MSTPRAFYILPLIAAAVLGASLGVSVQAQGVTDTTAIYVAPPPAGDDSYTGSSQLPVATLSKAIQLAAAASPRKPVHVAAGAYTISTTLSLASGVHVYGQFSGPPDWQRDAQYETIISGPATAVLAQDIAEETHLEGFTIRSADAAGLGQSSYALRIVDSAGPVVVRFNTILPGHGAAGLGGFPGISGLAGDPGQPGEDGQADSSGGGAGGAGGVSFCSRTGGNGGKGGYDTTNGEDGAAGGDSLAGGAGGASAACPGPADSGGSGLKGRPGANGVNGLAGAAVGGESGGFYAPPLGTPATAGEDGRGGSGGGGGGGGLASASCLADRGGGGGGGGAGGCAGMSGGRGNSGGGSFGIFIARSTVQIEDNTITTGTGGAGGTGGNGALGGAGGGGAFGGAGYDSAGGGGPGGDGGHGGAGGSGVGGAGGPSMGIFQISSIGWIGANTITTSAAGAGGAGGSNSVLGQAPSGPAGMATGVYPSLPVIGSVTVTPARVGAGDPVKVSAVVTGSVVTGVSAAGKALANTSGNLWEGTITAELSLGSHALDVLAAIPGGMEARKAGAASYTVQQVLGIGSRAAAQAPVTLVTSDRLFRLWGRARSVGVSGFTLDDGSGNPVTVNAPAWVLTGVSEGAYVQAHGVLDATARPPVLQAGVVSVY